MVMVTNMVVAKVIKALGTKGVLREVTLRETPHGVVILKEISLKDGTLREGIPRVETGTAVLRPNRVRQVAKPVVMVTVDLEASSLTTSPGVGDPCVDLATRASGAVGTHPTAKDIAKAREATIIARISKTMRIAQLTRLTKRAPMPLM